MSKFMLFALTATMLFLTSCGNKVVCNIDNPTDKEMKVSIDGKEIVLSPKEFRKLDDISVGEHKMVVDGAEEQTFVVENACMINPAGQEYVIWMEEYTMGTPPQHLEMVPVTVGGTKYEGPFEVRTGNPISYNDINYNTITVLPQQAEMPGSASYVIKRKIYRSDDFKADPASRNYLAQ